MTKQIKIRLVVYVLLTMIIVAFIFTNSMKSGEESYKQSQGLVKLVETILDPDDKIPTEDFNYAVRKVAHGLEFTLLGFSLGGLMGCVYDTRKHLNIPMSLLCGLLIAVADEFIQIFSGRTSSVSDVLIDFGGVVLGVAISMLILGIRLRRMKIAEKNNENAHPA